MKLKYKQEGYDEGLIILESEPQFRSVFIKSETRNSIRLPFPYLYFTIAYVKVDNMYQYEGYYGHGLTVYAGLKPLSSLRDKMFLLPIEMSSYGAACTNHAYDNKLYNSLFELSNEVLSLWWGSIHSVYGIDIVSWSELSLNELDKIRFFKLPFYESEYLQNIEMYRRILNPKNLIDEQWNPKSALQT